MTRQSDDEDLAGGGGGGGSMTTTKVAKRARVCMWIGPLCILTGCVCLATAIATTHWLEYEEGGAILIHGGLFQGCLPEHNDTCRSWDDTPFDTFNLKLSIAAFIVANVGHLLNFVMMSYFAWNMVSRTRGSACFLIFWFIILGMNIAGICFFREFQTQSYTMVNLKYYTILTDMHHGYSFHLSWGAIILVAVGALASWFIASHYLVGRGEDGFFSIDDEDDKADLQGVYTSKERLQNASNNTATTDVDTVKVS